MANCLLISVMGCALIALGVAQRDALAGLVWLGGNFLVLGIAHGFSYHGVFGKRSDGTIPTARSLFFLPLLAITTAVWHLARLFSRGPATNRVTPDLVVGRRLLASEIDQEFDNCFDNCFDNYVDLTAEFSEPSPIRQRAGYVCFPILDGAAPDPEALRAMISRLRPGKTFVHCAQGYGRTGLFASALLITQSAAVSAEDALQILQAARPGIRLNRQQLSCATELAKLVSQTAPRPSEQPTSRQ